MAQFVKKPVVVEAWHFDGSWDSFAAIPAPGDMLWTDFNGGEILISTLEGEMTASPGDWIIRGIKGEVYPCKPDIFAATYEAVESPGAKLADATKKESP